MRRMSIDACRNDEERKQVVAAILWKGIQIIEAREAEEAAKKAADSNPEATALPALELASPECRSLPSIARSEPENGTFSVESTARLKRNRATTTARRKAVEL